MIPSLVIICIINGVMRWMLIICSRRLWWTPYYVHHDNYKSLACANVFGRTKPRSARWNITIHSYARKIRRLEVGTVVICERSVCEKTDSYHYIPVITELIANESDRIALFAAAGNRVYVIYLGGTAGKVFTLTVTEGADYYYE